MYLFAHLWLTPFLSHQNGTGAVNRVDDAFPITVQVIPKDCGSLFRFHIDADSREYGRSTAKHV